MCGKKGEFKPHSVVALQVQMENSSKKTDFLVLGQGLTGTTLAMQLIMRGFSVQILTDPSIVSSSEKAVGLMNPVTGRRMAKTWNFEEIFPLAESFYSTVYDFLNPGQKGSFLLIKPIYKALHSIEEANFLSGKSSATGYENLIHVQQKQSVIPPVFSNTETWCSISKGGRMDTLVYLHATNLYFRNSEIVTEGHFNPEFLIRTANTWKYKSIESRFVISCLGNGCPWKSADMWPVKGQVYELSGLPDWGDAILKTEKFLIPTGTGTVLAGSTYEREFDHENPDSVGYDEITRDIEPDLKEKMRVVNCWAGIRPTTKDRRPIIEKIDSGLFALNGMGAKGVSLSPWAAMEITKQMLEEW